MPERKRIFMPLAGTDLVVTGMLKHELFKSCSALQIWKGSIEEFSIFRPKLASRLCENSSRLC